MEGVRFESKVDWWIPVLMVVSVAFCFIGPMIDGDFVAGVILGVLVLMVEVLIFAGVKYEIRGNQLGIRNFFRWTWYPIDKISEVKKHRSVLTAAALSFDRLGIKFSDKSILKSSMPLDISPKDTTRFLEIIKQINPDIVVK